MIMSIYMKNKKENDYLRTFIALMVLIMFFMYVFTLYKYIELKDENARLNNLIQDQGNEIVRLRELSERQ